MCHGPANGGIPGLVYRSQDWGQNYAGSYSWRASASYVTGWQSLKVGYQGTYLSDIRTYVDSIAFRAAERVAAETRAHRGSTIA
jgi:hypothetical protein